MDETHVGLQKESFLIGGIILKQSRDLTKSSQQWMYSAGASVAYLLWIFLN